MEPFLAFQRLRRVENSGDFGEPCLDKVPAKIEAPLRGHEPGPEQRHCGEETLSLSLFTGGGVHVVRSTSRSKGV